MKPHVEYLDFQPGLIELSAPAYRHRLIYTILTERNRFQQWMYACGVWVVVGPVEMQVFRKSLLAVAQRVQW